MATIYTKGSKKTRVLSPREGATREFDFGDWTEIRIGMFISAVAATGPNNASVAETLAVSTVSDNCTFGIKNSGQAIPGTAGSLFLGMKQKASSVVAAGGNNGINDASGQGSAIGYNGVTAVAGTGGDLALDWSEQLNVTGAAPYANFNALQFIITNRGLASQSVQIKSGKNNPAFPISDYSATSLRTQLNNYNWAGEGAINVAWNDGVAAYDIPNCVWIRCPLFLNSLRVACVRAIRYAP